MTTAIAHETRRVVSGNRDARVTLAADGRVVITCSKPTTAAGAMEDAIAKELTKMIQERFLPTEGSEGK
jgi:hypothetical protein